MKTEEIKKQAENYAEKFRFIAETGGWYQQKVDDFTAGYEAALRQFTVMQQREQLFDFLRWYSDHRKLDYSDSHILVMIEKYQKSNNCA
jgi:hypothetical protein